MIDDFGPRLPIEEPKQTPKAETGPTDQTVEPSVPQPAAEPSSPPPRRSNATIKIDMSLDDTEPPETAEKKRRARLDPKAWFLSMSKKQRIAVIAAVVIVLGACGTSFALLQTKPPVTEPAVAVNHAPAPKVTTVASRLTGLPVDPVVNDRPITGIMIENSTDARPQSGLDKAGVVFEAIAEGGITRFMALFQDEEPDYVGPVRSVRPYFLQWCQSFDCAIGHVGGSPEALQNIKDWHIRDLDQFFAAGSYHRVSTRPAPHNMFTSLSDLRALEDKRGYTSSSFESLPRAQTADKASGSNTAATSIDINFSSALYNTHYDYDSATKTYKRSEGGAPHNVVDKAGTATQLAPKVVIALVTSYGLEADGKHSVYGVTGSGEATIFQNGQAIHGTWTKASVTDQYSFLDDAGTTITLAPGQTWIAVVSAANKVSYQ